MCILTSKKVVYKSDTIKIECLKYLCPTEFFTSKYIDIFKSRSSQYCDTIDFIDHIRQKLKLGNILC